MHQGLKSRRGIDQSALLSASVHASVSVIFLVATCARRSSGSSLKGRRPVQTCSSHSDLAICAPQRLHLTDIFKSPFGWASSSVRKAQDPQTPLWGRFALDVLKMGKTLTGFRDFVHGFGHGGLIVSYAHIMLCRLKDIIPAGDLFGDAFLAGHFKSPQIGRDRSLLI